MAEPLCEPVAALSPAPGSFPRNMRTVNHQIREVESTFGLAGAGTENCEKTVAARIPKNCQLNAAETPNQTKNLPKGKGRSADPDAE